METGNESPGVCEKLFKAITGNSSHPNSGRPKVTDSSNLQKADKSGTTHISIPLKIQSYHHSKKKEQSASVFLEIEGGREEVQKPAFSSLKEGKVVKVRPNIVIEGPDHHQPAAIMRNKTENHERFTDYISQVKDKMRSKFSFSDHGEYAKAPVAARSATRKDSFNDKVANYIHRARNNIRTTSSVGDTKP